MTIISSLVAQYDRLSSSVEVPTPGFSSSPISFEVVLDREGNVVNVLSLGVERQVDRKPSKTKKSAKKVASSVKMMVPAAVGRSGTKAVSNLFWDNTKYVFGVSSEAVVLANAAAAAETSGDSREADLDKMRAAARLMADKDLSRHEEFKRAQLLALEGQELDDGLAALKAFVERWDRVRYAALENAEAMLDANVVFRLETQGKPVHLSRRAVDIVVARSLEKEAGESLQCLVTGRRGGTATLHGSIKGVFGSNSTGAKLVSFNQDSGTSYGKDQGANAPVSSAAAFAYATALNHMLADRSHCMVVGDMTVVFWSEADAPDDAEEAETLFSVAVGARSAEGMTLEKLRLTLGDLKSGKYRSSSAKPIDPASPFKVLGMVPNAARLSVRLWLDGSIGSLSAMLVRHHDDLATVGLNRVPTVRALLRQLAPCRKQSDGSFKASDDDAPSHLAQDLMKVVLKGARYPSGVVPTLVGRMRTDKQVVTERIALLKAAMIRQGVKVPVAIDTESTEVGYRLGRLFASLEHLQKASSSDGGGSIGSTLTDKFLGSASVNPGKVFPSLMRNSQAHLGKLRKVKKEIWHSRLIQEVFEGLDPSNPFPARLDLVQQGQFFVGYHHQKSAIYTKRAEAEAAVDDIQEQD